MSNSPNPLTFSLSTSHSVPVYNIVFKSLILFGWTVLCACIFLFPAIPWLTNLVYIIDNSHSNSISSVLFFFEMKSTNHLWHEVSLSKDFRAIWKWNSTKAVTVSVFVSLLILTLFRILTGPPFDELWFKILQEQQPIKEKIHDKLIGGLLLAGLDESSCESRYQSNLYHRPRGFRPPSSYLNSKLRNYEALQKQCGPNTEPYNKAVEDIKSGREVTGSSACKYVLYIPIKGLGNRMLTLGATFLYALLTNRVMFIGDGGDMTDLFCEPFPEVSWKLPSDFPLSRIRNSRPFAPYNRYGDLLQNGTFGDSSVPSFVYFYLGYGYDNYEKNFFCDHDQELLQQVPWIVLRSDLYFLPSLFLVPSFQPELDNLFLEKETVFHHLSRYLFHPSNSVWGLITRYYDAYLASADEILGIQIRVYKGGGSRKAPLPNQVMECAVNENWLPDINITEPIIKKSNNPKKKAVLVTSLSANHSEYLKKMYWQYATVTGEAIPVHQTCHDEYQRSQNQMHDTKALADIYLLSLSDKLMISGYSTFGYAAQSLGGLRPWILNMPHGEVVPNPPCEKTLSMEPCYHYAPSFYDCPNTSKFKTAFHVPYVQYCEDFRSGLKLFDEP